MLNARSGSGRCRQRGLGCVFSFFVAMLFFQHAARTINLLACTGGVKTIRLLYFMELNLAMVGGWYGCWLLWRGMKTGPFGRHVAIERHFLRQKKRKDGRDQDILRSQNQPATPRHRKKRYRQRTYQPSHTRKAFAQKRFRLETLKTRRNKCRNYQ